MNASRPAKIITTAALAVAAVYFLAPVYWLFVAATKSTPDLYGTNGFLFVRPQLGTNLHHVFTFQGSIFLRWALNSVLYSVVGALLATLLAAALGYSLAFFSFRGREFCFNVVLAGVLIPGTVLTLPLFFMFSKLHLANTVWAVLLPSVVSPFGVFLSRVYAVAAVPVETIEAARLDGAGETRIFGTLALRIMSPALVTIFLFQLVASWNNYFLPLVMLSDTKLYPITLGLASWQSYANHLPELGQLTVIGSALSIIPLIVAMVALQRFWRSGLTEGAGRG